MFNARSLILKEGIAAARKLAGSASERVSIDAAWAMMGQPCDDLVYASSVVSTLPHKGGGRRDAWSRDTGEDGVYAWSGGRFEGEDMGVPFGAKSRMILLHLLNEAIRTNSRTVTSGSSMYEWARMISSQSLGGMTYSMVLDHSMRIAAASLSVTAPPGARRPAIRGPIVEKIVMRTRPVCEAKRGRSFDDLPKWVVEFPESILLDQAVFEHFRDRAAPVRASALRQISNNSAAIDLYIRLATRLPALAASELTSWDSVAARFGSGYKNARQLKPAMHDVLQLVLAVYPEAKVEMRQDGLLLHNSPPPIAPPKASKAA